MKRISLIYFIITVIVFSSCVSKKKKEQTISISGAFALYPMVVKWSDEYKKGHPEVRFNISAGGAGKGMADALAGAVDLGMVSRDITEEEKQQGAWWIGLTKDAVLPTISAQNPYLQILKKQGLSRDKFRSIFIEGTVKNWGELLNAKNKQPIEVYTRSDACGAADTWAKYLGGKQEDLRGIGVFGDPGLAEVVVKDPSGIAFNNTIYIYDIKTGAKRPGLEVIPVDINGNGVIDPDEDFYESFEGVLKAIAEDAYPSPPARELYFVSKGKPSKQSVLDFIQWALTDGQQFTREAGYVPLSREKIITYIEKTK